MIATRERVKHFRETRNWPFNELYNALNQLCDILSLINPEIDFEKVIEHVVTVVDFDNIFFRGLLVYDANIDPDQETDVERVLEYIGITHIILFSFRNEMVNKSILEYQENIGNLSRQKADADRRRLIPVIYKLKTLAHRFNSDTNMFEEYQQFESKIEKRKRVGTFDYISLVERCNESLIRELIVGYQLISEALKEIAPLLPESVNPTEDIPKQSLTPRSITLSKTETLDLLSNELIQYFPDREIDLRKALEGKEIDTPLLFPHNQNKFVEVFRRLKYNNLILDNPSEIRDWLCHNFQFRYKKGSVTEIKPFNKSTVWDILTKGRGEPSRKERICMVHWLPYKSPSQMEGETLKER